MSTLTATTEVVILDEAAPTATHSDVLSKTDLIIGTVMRVSGISCVGHNMRSHDAPQTQNIDA